MLFTVISFNFRILPSIGAPERTAPVSSVRGFLNFVVERGLYNITPMYNCLRRACKKSTTQLLRRQLTTGTYKVKHYEVNLNLSSDESPRLWVSPNKET